MFRSKVHGIILKTFNIKYMEENKDNNKLLKIIVAVLVVISIAAFLFVLNQNTKRKLPTAENTTSESGKIILGAKSILIVKVVKVDGQNIFYKPLRGDDKGDFVTVLPSIKLSKLAVINNGNMEVAATLADIKPDNTIEIISNQDGSSIVQITILQ